MQDKLVLSYPHMGDYSVVFSQLFSHVFPYSQLLPPPPITQRTLVLGSRHSPDFVCSPFKYNLGNYLEALEGGANVLFQTGTGCRYGYYGELQQQILRDLGYDFQFACLSRERANPTSIYRTLHQLGCSQSAAKIFYAFFLACESCRILDSFDNDMRQNAGFQIVPGSFEAVRQELLRRIAAADSLRDIWIAESASTSARRRIKLDKPKHPFRVGIVGELYTVMEPFSNFFVEKQLAKEGISVSRQMGIWFLLFGQHHARTLRQCDSYLQYRVGANGTHSIAQGLFYAKNQYDGIIHIKSFGCIPELNASPALQAISRAYSIPVLVLTFDTHTSETGIQTRLEAFAEMIRMKKECPYAANS